MRPPHGLLGRHHCRSGRTGRLEASYAKLFCSQVGMRTVDKAVQILGGYGFISEFPVERMYRDMKGIEFGAGTTQIQKLIHCQETGQEGRCVTPPPCVDCSAGKGYFRDHAIRNMQEEENRGQKVCTV